jgi:RNA polymerase sigma factor (sigma-70 family)
MRPEPNFADRSDAELAPLYRQGIAGVLEILHCRYAAIFHRQALCLARRSNRFTTHDLFDAHFIHLCDRHTQYDPTRARDSDNPWQPWASTLLFNLGISWLRSPPPVDLPSSQGGDWSGFIDPDPGPLEETIRRELEESAGRCMGKLPGKQLQVMSLHLDGYSNPEIAKKLGITVEVVGQLLFHARENMAACLRQQGWEVNR